MSVVLGAKAKQAWEKKKLENYEEQQEKNAIAKDAVSWVTERKRASVGEKGESESECK